MRILSFWDYAFVFSMVLVWLILLYHILLTYFGYRYYLKSREYEDISDELPYYPFISVLVPAHNEEKVIGNTVDAIARSVYPKDKMEIIVINDSSTDKTGVVFGRKAKSISLLESFGD